MHSNLHYALYQAVAADRIRHAAPRRTPHAAPAPAALTRQGGVRRGAAGPPDRPRVGPARDRLTFPLRRDPMPAPREGGRAALRLPAGAVPSDSPRSAMEIVRREHREPFITLDGSEIRELAGIPTGNAANQSLAQATVAAGREHRRALPPRVRGDLPLHVAGAGPDVLGDERRPFAPATASSSRPAPSTSSSTRGAEPLVLLCCCAPAYSHEDTVITRPAGPAD